LAGLFASIIRIARPAAWLAVGALALGAAQFAAAQKVWTGPPGVAANWFDPGNWLDGVVPKSGTVTINNGGIAQRNQTDSTSISNLFLGSDPLSSGTLVLSAGSLSSLGLNIGVAGTGRLEQSGGTLITSNAASIGTGPTGSGVFVLSGGWFRHSVGLTIGSDGAGTSGAFTQTGGTSSVATLQLNSSGRYTLQGGALIVTSALSNAGTFDFAGGSGQFVVDSGAMANLSAGVLANTSAATVQGSTGDLIILPSGYSPAMFAAFSNPGKTHIAGTTLTIGPSESFTGWHGDLYDDVEVQGTLSSSFLNVHKGIILNGSGIAEIKSASIVDQTSGISGGTFSVSTLTIGSGSGASFTQAAGAVSMTGHSIGASPGDTGTYSLSGGTLTAINTTVGGAGTGTFVQSNGVSSFQTLAIAPGSTLRYTGGQLNLASLESHGTLDLAGIALTIAPTGIANFASTSFQGTSNATLTGAPNSLMIFSTGVDPASVFGSFSTLGVLHTAGTTLVVPTGQTIDGIGTISDPVELHGTMLKAVPIGGLTIYNGAVLNSGTMKLQNSSIDIRGGGVTLFGLTVVDGSTITQSGGTLSVGAFLDIGNVDSGAVTFRLEDGEINNTLSSPSQRRLNNGTFLQSGGTNRMFKKLSSTLHGISTAAGTSGYYELSGGTFDATGSNFSIGFGGDGTMVQSAGTALIGSLRVGEGFGGNGHYWLSSNGVLDGGRATAVGVVGQGTMVQSGGTFTTSWLAINADSAGPSGRVTKTDGYLAVGSLTIGDNGTFIHSGGTLTIPAMNNTGTAVLGGTQIWAPNSIATNFGFASFTSNAGAGGRNLTINDTEGTVVFSSSQTLNALNIGQGRASIVPGSNAVIGMLGLGMSVFSPVHAFDLADGTLVINYLSTTPAESVRSMLAADQLFSSLDDAQHRLGYAEVTQVYSPLPAMIGDEPIDSTGLIAQLTLAGDANLDGVVDAVDLGNLALHWTSSDAFWFDGDFTYDGRVDVADLKLLAMNFTPAAEGPSLETLLVSFGLPVEAIPEPAMLAPLAAAGMLLRRRHSARHRRTHAGF
jgi:hypothetical protein